MREPVYVHINHLLPTLSDALLEAPVLVQGWVRRGEEYQVACVAFPILDGPNNENKIEILNENQNDNNSNNTNNNNIHNNNNNHLSEWNAQNLQHHPSVLKLKEKLHLQSCFGFIRMLKIELPDQPTKTEWVPAEIHFGIPLHDSALNKLVCLGIKQETLLSPEKMELRAKNARELCVNLLDFITDFQDEELDLEVFGNVAFPNKTIIFNNGKLQGLNI
jgi:hypothetical protein